ncbi:molecular chaperone [Vibrio sp.]|uniref:fimbrial biogenesis chaperone n=1 Tax=Vibrio sp. TaxID=678 RepID=UPI003AA9AEB2
MKKFLDILVVKEVHLMIKKIKSIIIATFIMAYFQQAYAAINLDRTRVIYDGEQKSITLTIANQNEQLPYLAQVWIENDKEQKIMTGPIIATPPVQRVEAGAKSMIQLTKTREIMNFPHDRESLFYFNLREIPPRSGNANALQIALQTKIKLFYRPESIKAKPNAIWQDQMVMYKVEGGYKIENPTPYYITIIGIGKDEKSSKSDPFNAVMITPKSSVEVDSVENYKTVYLTYINDYGGRPVIKFECNNGKCISAQ